MLRETMMTFNNDASFDEGDSDSDTQSQGDKNMKEMLALQI